MSAKLKPEMMEELQVMIKDTVLELFPTLVKELIPIISVIIKEVTPVIVQTAADATKETNERRARDLQQQNETEKNFEEFKGIYKPKLDEVLQKRQKLYSTLSSFKVRLKLYDESLGKTPVYIPKEYRKDDYYVNDAEELEYVTRFQLERFKSEREIAAKRSRHFQSEIMKLDDEAAEIIYNADLPPAVEEKAILHWRLSYERDQERVDKKSTKQEASTRAAYTKDEQFWKKHQIDRIKKKSEPNVTANENPGSGQPSKESGWRDVPKIELVVVPDNSTLDQDLNNTMDEILKNTDPLPIDHPPVVPDDNVSDQDLSNAMNEIQKNLDPSVTDHPPGAQSTSSTGTRKKSPLPSKTTMTMRSERNSSTSHPST